jgi:hypothetical protein
MVEISPRTSSACAEPDLPEPDRLGLDYLILNFINFFILF